ncbi:MAG: hydantoin racemase [Thermoprotei archaeon]|nr:MAG: hydantoin racemase [Thermoprotei archaeon]
MVKILVLNPVSTDIWDDLTKSYLEKIAFPSTMFEVRSLKNGPKSIECEYDVSLATPYVVEEIVKAEREGFDAAIINCFDDPGLHASRERVTILVMGIGETSIITALYLGHKFAIVSTGPNVKALYHKKVMELGLEDRLAYVEGIPIGVLDLRKDIKRIKALLLEEAKKAINNYGAEVIVLGCGGFIGVAEEISKELAIPVIDPTVVTFKITESLAATKLAHSKKYLYRPPEHKLREWKSEHI